MSGAAKLRGVCLVAPSGSGKSTAARFMAERFREHAISTRVVKLAAPLYDLQRAFYDVAGRPIGEEAQNHHLLETIATELRAIDPGALARSFLSRLPCERGEVAINDDLRDMDVDMPVLRDAGFVFVKIEASPARRRTRLEGRGDLLTLYESPLDAPISKFAPDYVIANDGDELEGFKDEVSRFVDTIADRFASQ